MDVKWIFNHYLTAFAISLLSTLGNGELSLHKLIEIEDFLLTTPTQNSRKINVRVSTKKYVLIRI